MLIRLARRLLLPPAEPDTGGGLPFQALYPTAPTSAGIRRSAPGGRVRVAASTSSQLLAAANLGRTQLTIYNDSSAVLYIGHGPFATSSAFTVAIVAGGTYILEEPECYTGDVAGVWASATGAAEATEQSGGQ